MGFRPTPELRQRLALAAAENGRSLTQEIQSRLERSFVETDSRHESFGGEHNYRIFRSISGMASVIEARFDGKRWYEDPESFQAYEAFVTTTLRGLRPPTTKRVAGAYALGAFGQKLAENFLSQKSAGTGKTPRGRK